jgi:hypothetical protein
MTDKRFDTRLFDSQATSVQPVKPEQFDFAAWTDYEQSLLEECKTFRSSASGIAVYRRMRVAEVFSYGCKDMSKSLELQLGGLMKSMSYKADIPNFPEPWYGIGTAASAFGADYIWKENQAPAVKPMFVNTEEALKAEIIPIAETNIGRHTLKMIEYFLDKTKGKLPLSYCDVQSPFNVACNIVDNSNLLAELLMNPVIVKLLLDKISDLIIEFTRVQKSLIGDCLVLPGHGFASSRVFNGFGMSDDNIVMVSNELYEDVILPSFIKTGNALGGAVFHSCGNWASKVNILKKIPGMIMVDGAFTNETDPAPNDVEPIAESFNNTGIVVNARMVGNNETVIEKVKKLYSEEMKLIVVTYAKTAGEQESLYNELHKYF